MLQMSPLNWFTLFMYYYLIFYMIKFYIFFLTYYKILPYNKINNFNWKW